MVAFNFNAQLYTPNFGTSHEQLPPGKKYKVILKDGRSEPTKNGQGNMLVYDAMCVEGQLQGRSQIIRLNLQNPSPQAVQIANEQLSALCWAVGMPAIQDTVQLENKPFLIDVDWQKGNEPTKDKPEGGYTEVKSVYDLNGNKPGQQGGNAPAAAAPPPATAPAGVAPASNAGQWQQSQNGNGAAAPANNGWGGR